MTSRDRLRSARSGNRSARSGRRAVEPFNARQHPRTEFKLKRSDITIRGNIGRLRTARTRARREVARDGATRRRG